MSEKNKKNWYNKTRKGYIMLMSVLVVGAIGAAVSVSVILLGLAGSRTGLAYQQMHQAKALANACSEEALERIRESTPFVGTGNLFIGTDNCLFAVKSEGGENRTIYATGTVGMITRKTKVSVTAINPLIVVSEWREIP
jgi:hypothetical protein